MADFTNTTYCLLVFLISFVLVRYIFKTRVNRYNSIRSPPSPPALPIIGYLHFIGPILHRSFQNLSRRFGPLILLHIGASTCVVASSAAVIKEIIGTHENIFSSRPEFGSVDFYIYKESRFVTAEYGPYWRFMRKICMTKLLSGTQLNKCTDIRQQEIGRLLESLTKSYEEGKPIDISGLVTTMTNNIICRIVMSTRCSDSCDEDEEIKKFVKETLKLGGLLSVGDVLGPLSKFDLFGHGKKLKVVMGLFDKLLEGIMREHEEKRCHDKRGGDLMDVLLEIYRDENFEVKLTRNDIKSFILELFVAGTDLISTSIQWALAELINHPNKFKKLREEIDVVVGKSRLLQDSDVTAFPYLQAVVKETLRLHPPAPFIIRQCDEDCNIKGFNIMKGTRTLINVFAVMRDPDSWNQPDKFVPERFSNESFRHKQKEIKGQGFHYLPFGSGRRGCLGASLALNVVHATVGAMVQCFDWNANKDGVVTNQVNTEEGLGFSIV